VIAPATGVIDIRSFLRFLDRLMRLFPTHLHIHLVMDNYGTHKMPKVKRWFARPPIPRAFSRPPAPVG